MIDFRKNTQERLMENTFLHDLTISASVALKFRMRSRIALTDMYPTIAALRMRAGTAGFSHECMSAGQSSPLVAVVHRPIRVENDDV